MPARILVGIVMLLTLTASFSGCGARERGAFPVSPIEKALDGDTVVIDGEAYNIAGIDAPELGPWAKCWAEAALAGHARTFVETKLNETGWRIQRRGKDAKNRNVVWFAHKDGTYQGQADDLADEMIVYGYAARDDDKWDWCGPGNKLEPLKQGAASPHGPHLWWPANKVYDPRAEQ